MTEITGEDGSLGYDITWDDDNAGKELVLQYIQYLEYLSKWDGKLPTVVGDGSGIMITIPVPDGDQEQTSPTT